MTQPVIGFIGLGIMGRPMAGHLLRAGYPLIVHDVNRQTVAAVAAAGGREAFSPQEVAAASDVIITMLPDSPDVEAVALGPAGLIEGVRPGTLYADMSTIAPTVAVKVARTLAEKGVHCLDAPVSGGEVGAINATLSIMVGGSQADFEAMLPIFEKLGKTITLCGANGAGQIVKACNQIQVALNIVGMAEALVLGAKAGVDPAIIHKVLSGGYAQSRVADVRGAFPDVHVHHGRVLGVHPDLLRRDADPRVPLTHEELLLIEPEHVGVVAVRHVQPFDDHRPAERFGGSGTQHDQPCLKRRDIASRHIPSAVRTMLPDGDVGLSRSCDEELIFQNTQRGQVVLPQAQHRFARHMADDREVDGGGHVCAPH